MVITPLLMEIIVIASVEKKQVTVGKGKFIEGNKKVVLDKK